jgi:predicted O-methyltransferase YrrM
MDLEYIEKTVPTLHGWCTSEKATHLYNLVLEQANPLCVELGVFAGRSLLPIALGARHMGGSTVGIDSWSKEACEQGINDIANTQWWNSIDYDFFYNYTANVIADADLSSTTRLIRSKSADAVSQFESESISVLHQDSNHSEEVTVEEVNLWYNKVKMGGYWIFDDTDWHTTQVAQGLLLEKGYELVFTEKDTKYKVFVRRS